MMAAKAQYVIEYKNLDGDWALCAPVSVHFESRPLAVDALARLKAQQWASLRYRVVRSHLLFTYGRYEVRMDGTDTYRVIRVHEQGEPAHDVSWLGVDMVWYTVAEFPADEEGAMSAATFVRERTPRELDI